MNKKIMYIIGVLYSVVFCAIYNILNHIHREHFFHPSHWILTFISLFFALILVYIGIGQKNIFIGAIIGGALQHFLFSTVAFIILLIQNVQKFLGIGQNFNVSILDVIVFMEKSSLGLFFFCLILYLAYTVNKHNRRSLLSILLAAICCTVPAAALVFTAETQSTDIANKLLPFIAVLLPIVTYLIICVFIKNKAVFRSAVFTFWIVCVVPIIVFWINNFELSFSKDNYFSFPLCTTGLIVTVFAISAIHHLIAFIIYIFKKTSEAPLINQNIMITNYPPEV